MQRLREWWAARKTWLTTQRLRNGGRWLGLALLVLLILFGCGQVALWLSAPPASAETRSQLLADYLPWPYEVIQPVDPAIIEDIQHDENATPGDIPIVTEAFWPTPTLTPTPQPGAPTPTLTPTRPPATPASNTPEALTSPTLTSVAAGTSTTTPTPSRTATPTTTRTRTPTPTRTRTPTITSTRTRTATVTRTLSPTATLPPPPTATRTASPTITLTPPPTATRTPTPTSTATRTHTPTPTVSPTRTTTPTNTPAFVQIIGRVFEDTNYTGGAGTGFGAGDAGLPNVTVELYSGAVLIATTTTDATGQYQFVNLASTSTFVIRVVSASLGDADTPPAAGFNGGFSSAVAEQTFEHNGLSGNGGAGALGGNSPTISDFATAPGAGVGDTNVTIALSGADRIGVDLGFAYNLIVNTQNSGQGTLRQFIANANALAGANSSQFSIPTTDPNFNTLIANAFVIQPVTALPILTDSFTTLDGTTQENNRGDQRAGLPDIVIDGSLTPTSAGLHLQASLSALRKLDVRSFNGAGGFGLVLDGTAGGGDGNTLADNYLTANSPNNGAVGALQVMGAADNNLFVGNTLIGNNGDGLEFDSSAGTGNQIINNTFTLMAEDGAVLRGSALTFTGNTITFNGVGVILGCGVETFDLTNSLLDGNTALGNGFRGGLCLFANTNNNTVSNNTLTNNQGPGLQIMPGASLNNRFTQNSISGNASIGIDLNFDGVTANDAGDGDSGPNDFMNFPVIYSAVLDGFGNITLTGEARPGATIEFFIADGDASGFGEGQTFIASAVEGSGTDTNPGAGIVDGTAAQFTFVLPAGGLTSGLALTATATDATGNTSEFSLNVTVL